MTASPPPYPRLITIDKPVSGSAGDGGDTSLPSGGRRGRGRARVAGSGSPIEFRLDAASGVPTYRRFDQAYAEARLAELGIPLKRKAGKLSGGQQAQLALAELERVADYLILLSRGRVQVAGEVDDLLTSHRMLTGPAAGRTDIPNGR